jgi:hypothetical protein
MAMTLGEKEGGRSRLGHDWGDNGSVSVVMMAWSGRRQGTISFSLFSFYFSPGEPTRGPFVLK